jgi:hypothetical protein
MELTTEVLRELLDYDKETGIFTWKARERSWFKTERSFKMWNTRYAGKAAGYVYKNLTGYPSLTIRVFGRLWLAHRIAFIWMGKALPDQVDHLNRNSIDNRWENLLASSAKENMKNLSMMRNNTSGVTGVYWNKASGKWMARVKINGKFRYLGYFTDLQEAAKSVEAFRAANGFSEGHGRQLANYAENSVDSVI